MGFTQQNSTPDEGLEGTPQTKVSQLSWDIPPAITPITLLHSEMSSCPGKIRNAESLSKAAQVELLTHHDLSHIGIPHIPCLQEGCPFPTYEISQLFDSNRICILHSCIDCIAFGSVKTCFAQIS